MAKKQAEAAEAHGTPATVEVRALVDNAAHGLVAGALALIAPELLDSLKAAGAVDDHPEAVAFAKGAP